MDLIVETNLLVEAARQALGFVQATATWRDLIDDLDSGSHVLAKAKFLLCPIESVFGHCQTRILKRPKSGATYAIQL